MIPTAFLVSRRKKGRKEERKERKAKQSKEKKRKEKKRKEKKGLLQKGFNPISVVVMSVVHMHNLNTTHVLKFIYVYINRHYMLAVAGCGSKNFLSLSVEMGG